LSHETLPSGFREEINPLLLPGGEPLFFDIINNLLYFLVKLPSPFTRYGAGEIKISIQLACSL
jgi:hypothetical protein